MNHNVTRGWSVSAKIGWFTGPRQANGCRPWAGALDHLGYAKLFTAGRMERVSRLLAGLALGDRRVAMHTCDNPACVEPTHVRAATQSENLLDAVAKRRNARSQKTHCPSGHEYTTENTRVWNGGRYCRTCSRLRNALIRDRLRPGRKRRRSQRRTTQ